MRIKLATFALLGLATLGGCANGQAAGRPWNNRSAMQAPVVGKPTRLSQQLKVNREIKAQREIAGHTVVDGNITR
ncbi:hypothetical protein EP7_005026 [Isosphaeraceae bacterium EP7]